MKVVKTVDIPVPEIGARIIALNFCEYHDGNLAMLATLVFDDTGEENVAVSTNLPNHASMLKGGMFFAKNWSEGAPTFNALIKSGELVDTGARVPTGFVSAPVCYLKDVPPHDCYENAVPYKSDGPLGHGWECGLCGRFLQAG